MSDKVKNGAVPATYQEIVTQEGITCPSVGSIPGFFKAPYPPHA